MEKRFYDFGPFRIDAEKRGLLRNGEAVPLAPKAFDMLLVLVQHAGTVLEKDQLLEMLWPDSFIEEGNLTYNISAIRKALGESPSERRYIVTIPSRGYRFAAEVKEVLAGDSALIVERHRRSTLVIQEREDAPQQQLVPAITGSPSNRPWTAVLAAVVILAVVGIGIGAYLLLKGSKPSPPPSKVRSLAVLPFKALVEGGDEYLGIGMTDILITRLSNLREVAVRPTSAVLKYTDTGKDAVEIGRELGVDSVLEGSIRRSAGQIRVTVQLVSVREGARLWAEKFDTQFTDMFAVEDSISELVAERLASKLSREEREALAKHDTDNPAAHLLYLEGRYQIEKRTPDAATKAIESFGHAIEKDSNYALAYSGMAEGYFTLSVTGNRRPSEAFPMSKEAATKALALDPQLVEAHTILGIARFFNDWDWAAAERDFKRAIEINPNFPLAHEMYGHLLSNLGRHREALEQINRALELDPLSLIANAIKGQMLQFAGRYDDAVSQLEKAIDVEPGFWISHLTLGKVYERKRLYPEALAEFQRAWELSGHSPEPKSLLGYTYALSGNTSEARRIIDELKKASAARYVPPKHIALIYAGLGEKNEMFDWLERAYEDRDISLTFMKVEPRWDLYRADPRFLDLLRRVGLSQT
jgi:DNA-binding winged helix-turn-helix (wHTH) protein/TolB-like protein/Flp pilus assembly protein TadD